MLKSYLKTLVHPGVLLIAILLICMAGGMKIQAQDATLPPPPAVEATQTTDTAQTGTGTGSSTDPWSNITAVPDEGTTDSLGAPSGALLPAEAPMAAEAMEETTPSLTRTPTTTMEATPTTQTVTTTTPETTTVTGPGLIPETAPDDQPTSSATETQAAREVQKAPYLRRLRQQNIFDPSKNEELSPMQKTARQKAHNEAFRKRIALTNIRELTTFEYTITGPNKEAVMEEAMVRALKSTAGRFYFENYYILGRDILEPYLRQNGKKFLLRSEVLGQRITADNKIMLRVKVSVNQDLLKSDLMEKRFIAEPNLRPIIGVSLKKTIAGNNEQAAEGRKRIEETLQQNLFRTFSEKLVTLPLTTDMSTTTGLLDVARRDAQRNNIDILITGELGLKSSEQSQLYYDNYSFQDAETTLSMYRVDNGELIMSLHDRYSASAASIEEARQKVLNLILDRMTQKMAQHLREMWTNTMLDQSDYRLMISGVDAGQIPSIQNLLRSFSPQLRIFEKSYYGDVLVLNLQYPNTPPDQLERMLKGSRVPQFMVQRVDKQHFQLELL